MIYSRKTPNLKASFAALILAALALAAHDAAAQTAPNRAPSPNGKIVYTSDEQNREVLNNQIWVMDADGRNKTRLTVNQDEDTSPVFSPDGQTIAFSRSAGGTRLYVMKADGSGPQTAGAPPPGFSTGVNKIEWSPDGKSVKYENFGGAWVQRVFNPDGTVTDSNVQPINVSTRAENLRWSPSGAKLVYFWPGNNPEGSAFLPRGIYTVNPDGTGRTKIAEVSADVMDARPSWSALGRIAYVNVGAAQSLDIFVVNADGSGLMNVTDTSGVDELAPEWSPDGSKVALFWDDGTVSGVGVVSMSTPGAVLHLAEVVNAAGSFGFNDALFWSPDSMQIVYHDDVASHQTGTIAGSQEVYVVDADGGRQSNYTKSRRYFERAGNWQRVTP